MGKPQLREIAKFRIFDVGQTVRSMERDAELPATRPNYISLIDHPVPRIYQKKGWRQLLAPQGNTRACFCDIANSAMGATLAIVIRDDTAEQDAVSSLGSFF